MFRFIYVLTSCLLFSLMFSACSKLNTFVTEEEAKAAIVEVLQKSNESASAQNQNYSLMTVNEFSKIQFPQVYILQLNIINNIPSGNTTYATILENINKESCDLSKELKPIINTAIVNTTYDDVYYLTSSNEPRATYYLKTQQEQAIKKQIAPIIYTKIHGSDFEKAYISFQDSYNFIMGSDVLNQDLSAYLAQEITNRYFVYMAKEEQQIRIKSRLQSSAIIKKVFENN